MASVLKRPIIPPPRENATFANAAVAVGSGENGTAFTPLTMRAISPLRQYVGGNSPLWYNTKYYRSLSLAIDDITTDFGDDLYDRVLLDPQPASCVIAFKAAILEDGLTLTSKVQNKDAEGYKQATDILEFCETALDALRPKLNTTLWSLLDAVAYGYKSAEQVYVHDRTYTGKDRIVLQSLKVKPRDAVSFVCDVYDNVVGMLAKIPGVPWPILTGTLYVDPTTYPNILPPWKFATLSFRQKDSDPRGTSILRPCFDPWWTKQQIKPQFLQYLTQFASPGLVGIGPESNSPQAVIDKYGNPVVDPTTGNVLQVNALDALLQALLAFRNGSAVVVPHGGDVKAISMAGEGEAFLNAFARCDMEIAKSILSQTLATEQTQHQTRAASTVHQDTLDTLVRQAKADVCNMVVDQILTPLIVLNFGDQGAKWCPVVSLGRTEERDMAAMTNAVSQLMATGYLDPSQLPELDVRLGLPVRTSIQSAIDLQTKKAGATAPAGAPPAPGGANGNAQK
jgi:hypothetical protein